MLSFFPRGVFDEILNLIESVSDGFPSYSSSAGTSYNLIWIRVGQGPSALAVGAGGGCLDIFLSSIISLFFLPLSGRRPRYCLKGP